MQRKYLIVSKKILPEAYDQVIEARNLINNGSVKGVSEAVKKVGISRSTYYKYKDYVFSPSENSMGRKAVVSMMLNHEKGVLSNMLNYMASEHVNILTINQSIPINGNAHVNLSLDISDIKNPVDDILEKLRSMKGVGDVRLLAIE